MLSKEEAFTVQEFINKNSYKKVYEVTEILYALISELKKDKNETNNEQPKAAAA